MNTDFSYLLTDICETRGPKGKRMAEYLERMLYAIVHGEQAMPMYIACLEALKDRDCLEQWEEDK